MSRVKGLEKARNYTYVLCFSIKMIPFIYTVRREISYIFSGGNPHCQFRTPKSFRWWVCARDHAVQFPDSHLYGSVKEFPTFRSDFQKALCGGFVSETFPSVVLFLGVEGAVQAFAKSCPQGGLP